MRIIIVGASSTYAKFGNKAVRAYLRAGHEVLPVNPNESEVEGLSTYPKVQNVPGYVDRVAMYVPPKVGESIITELVQRGQIGELWFNPGSETPELVARARDLGLNVKIGCAIIDIGEFPD